MGYLQVAAVIAFILMPAQDRGPACLDGAHDPPIIPAQPVCFSVRRAVLTEDVRNLKAARCSHPLAGLRRLVGCSIERTYNLGQVQTTDMQIDGGRCGRSVTKKQLDMVEARSRFYEVGGKAMPQGMNAYRFCDAGTLYCGAKDRLHRRQRYMTILLLALKQPFRGAIFFPVLP